MSHHTGVVQLDHTLGIHMLCFMMLFTGFTNILGMMLGLCAKFCVPTALNLKVHAFEILKICLMKKYCTIVTIMLYTRVDCLVLPVV